MKLTKKLTFLFTIAMILSAFQLSAQEKKWVAKDDAVIQTSDKTRATRKVPVNGTKIIMRFGSTEIPGVLNDSITAQALIKNLPYTVHMTRYSHDFCGIVPAKDFPHKESEVHYGWLNGDIDYATDGPYFTILFEDEEKSERYGNQVNIGVITCPIQKISSLRGSFDVRIELAE